jgi:hypothetical protein
MQSRRIWEPFEDDILRCFYPCTKAEYLAIWIGCSVQRVYHRANILKLKKSAEWLTSDEACNLRAHPEIGERGRFKKGHVPLNKGIKRPKGWSPGRMAETQFKKGVLAGYARERWKPLGSERLSKEGYLEVKFRERKGQYGNWKSAHVLLWEGTYGPVPEGYAVAFKDGDKSHIVLDNLELISRAELMRRNTVHNLPKDLQLVIQLNGALKRKLRKLSEKQAE